MKVNRTKVESQRLTVEIWHKLVDHPKAPRIQMSSDQIATDLGYKTGEIDGRLKTFRHLGMTKLEMAYEWQKTIPTQVILVSKDEGDKILREFFPTSRGSMVWRGLGTRKNKATTGTPTTGLAVQTSEDEEPIAAITGDDAPKPFDTPAMRELRKDEPAAWVEAARQYSNRMEYVNERLNEIEKLGVTIDRSKVMAGINLETDETLEGVVKVLPYIDELRARAEQSGEWRRETVAVRNEMRTLRNENGTLQAELNRQKDANKRLAEKLAQNAVNDVNGVRRPVVIVGDQARS